MSARKAGFFALGIGIFIILISLIVDYMGLGKKGIQAAQLLGLQIGIVIAILGWAIAKHSNQALNFGIFFQQMKERFLTLPSLAMVVAGFVLAYILLFIFPMFLNPEHTIQYFNRYVPEISPIGHDLIYANASIKGWLSGQSLYDNQNLYYPPLYAAIFAPTLLLGYPANYYLITFLTLACMTALFFTIPLLSNGSKQATSLSAFFFLTALFSYGMQFELERGQFNIIAFTLCVLSVYIYHYHNSLRYYAYLLFSISIQIKIYPVVLVLMFIKDWRDWKGNVLRFLGLGVFNIALLFVLGWQVFLDYTKALPILLNVTWSRPYNHSIRSFVYELASSGYGILSSTMVSWLKTHLTLIELFLMAFYFICLLTVLIKAYKNKEHEMNFNLLLICTIGAMILPSASVDYKLPIVAFPLAAALSYKSIQSQGIKRVMAILLITLLSFAYSTTLFPFIHKPELLTNNLPMLLVILAAVTVLNLMETTTPSTILKIDADQIDLSFS